MTPIYMLDTNICIYISKRQPSQILHRFEELSVGDAVMSVITYGELLYGVSKSRAENRSKNAATLDLLSHVIQPLPLDKAVSDHYGSIRHFLQKKGTPIGGNDLWIAAHALASDLILVTNNEKEFHRVPNLKVENWA